MPLLNYFILVKKELYVFNWGVEIGVGEKNGSYCSNKLRHHESECSVKGGNK